MPRKHKFKPRIAEIVEFLEAGNGTHSASGGSRRTRTVSTRITGALRIDRTQRLSYEELKAKYGDWTKEMAPKRTEKPDPFSIRQIDASEITVSPYLKKALAEKKIIEQQNKPNADSDQ